MVDFINGKPSVADQWSPILIPESFFLGQDTIPDGFAAIKLSGLGSLSWRHIRLTLWGAFHRVACETSTVTRW